MSLIDILKLLVDDFVILVIFFIALMFCARKSKKIEQSLSVSAKPKATQITKTAKVIQPLQQKQQDLEDNTYDEEVTPGCSESECASGYLVQPELKKVEPKKRKNQYEHLNDLQDNSIFGTMPGKQPKRTGPLNRDAKGYEVFGNLVSTSKTLDRSSVKSKSRVPGAIGKSMHMETEKNPHEKSKNLMLKSAIQKSEMKPDMVPEAKATDI